MSVDKPYENWTKFPNCILDNIDRIEPMEFKVLGFMIRKNLGYENPNKMFALDYIMLKCKIISKSTAKKAVDGLIEKGLVSRKLMGNSPAVFEILWAEPKILTSTKSVPDSDNNKRGTENVPVQVQKSYSLKENNTKENISSISDEIDPKIAKTENLDNQIEQSNIFDNQNTDNLTDKKHIKSDTNIDNKIEPDMLKKSDNLDISESNVKKSSLFVHNESDHISHAGKMVKEKEPDPLDDLVKFWNDEMNENIIISKKSRGSIYGIIKTQSLDRLKKAITQAKKQLETKKGIRYTFGSIIYKDSNISNLCAQYDKDDPYKNMPESTRKKLEEMRRKK